MSHLSETTKTYDTFPDIFEEKFTDFFSRFGKQEADRFLQYLNRPSKILDIGSGPGLYAEYFNRQGHTAMCVDPSAEMIRLCKKRGLQAESGTVEKLRFEDNEFDAVWANAVILHLPRAQAVAAIGEIARVTKPNGIVYISVKEGMHEGFEERETLPGTKRWFSHFTEDELRSHVKNHFKILHFSRTNVDNRFNFIQCIVRKTVNGKQ